MPADQTRMTIYNPKVEPNPRDLVHQGDRGSAVEDAATELAFQIACEDSTEKDHLASTTLRARARVKAAAAELVRAMIALILAWLGRLLVDRSYRKITAQRGVVGRAERGALALQRLLSGLFVRKVLGRRSLLRMLGASRHGGEGGAVHKVHSLKLAERRYRIGEGRCGQGHATAADSPTVRVLIGIRIAADGEPVWCLKRFVSTETGSWNTLYSGYEADAESVLISFYSQPSPAAAGSAPEPVEEAPVMEAPVEVEQPDRAA